MAIPARAGIAGVMPAYRQRNAQSNDYNRPHPISLDLKLTLKSKRPALPAYKYG